MGAVGDAYACKTKDQLSKLKRPHKDTGEYVDASGSEAEESEDIPSQSTDDEDNLSRASDLEDFIDQSSELNVYGLWVQDEHSWQAGDALLASKSQCAPNASKKIRTHCNSTVVQRWRSHCHDLVMKHPAPGSTDSMEASNCKRPRVSA